MIKRMFSLITVLMSLVLTLLWVFSMWQSHVEDKGIALVAQANSLVKAGDSSSLQQAVTLFKKAVETFHGMNNDKQARNEGLSYYGLARAYHALKQNEQAIAADTHALPLLTSKKSQ